MQYSKITRLLSLTVILLSSTVFATEVNISENVSKVLSEHLVNDKWLVVKVWSSDCLLCKSSMKATSDADIKNTEIIGISADGINSNAKTAGGRVKKSYDTLLDLKADFPNYVSDMAGINNILKRSYGQSKYKDIVGYPTYFIYSPGGETVDGKRTPGKVLARQAGNIEITEIRDYILSKSK